MAGFDEYNTILLPPRLPGDPLPKLLLDHYEEVNKPIDVPTEINIPIIASASVTEPSISMKAVSPEISKESLEKADVTKGIFVVHIFLMLLYLHINNFDRFIFRMTPTK